MGCRILFVCTGNTCRSPMAEAIARDRAGADESIEFASAGLRAAEGAPASAGATAAAAEVGLDLGAHAAIPFTPRVGSAVDHIYVMTEAQRRTLLEMDPGLGGKVVLLDPDGRDVPDPHGRDIDAFRAAREAIAAALARRSEEWRDG
jgi:protein-tyrosine-phosphatase